MTDDERQNETATTQMSEVGNTDADEAWKAIQRVIDLQDRLTYDPERVDDEEIRAEYGKALAPSAIRELFSKSTFGRRAKDERASARGRLRRRLGDLAGALEDAELAIEDVFSAPGRTNGRQELERLKTEIARFRQDNPIVGARPVDQRELRPLEEMFAGEGAWPGPAEDAASDAVPQEPSGDR